MQLDEHQHHHRKDEVGRKGRADLQQRLCDAGEPRRKPDGYADRRPNQRCQHDHDRDAEESQEAEPEDVAGHAPRQLMMRNRVVDIRPAFPQHVARTSAKRLKGSSNN